MSREITFAHLKISLEVVLGFVCAELILFACSPIGCGNIII